MELLHRLYKAKCEMDRKECRKACDLLSGTIPAFAWKDCKKNTYKNLQLSVKESNPRLSKYEAAHLTVFFKCTDYTALNGRLWIAAVMAHLRCYSSICVKVLKKSMRSL
jgi:hypothetical protein